MPCPAYPNQIKLEDIQTEFGGSHPTGLFEYYAGGAYVPTGVIGYPGGVATPVPSSGTISVENFQGAARSTFHRVEITSSQSWTAPTSLVGKINVLLVGGGGGGGTGQAGVNGGGGGGGAGGYVLATGTSVILGNTYTITIGQGASGASNSSGGGGGNGGNTQAFGYTAYGGGGGAGSSGGAGSTNASGGGGNNSGDNGRRAPGTSGSQGSPGGEGGTDGRTYDSGGGGGGAGYSAYVIVGYDPYSNPIYGWVGAGLGGNSSGSTPGAGGAGVTITLDGKNYAICGGGAGGSTSGQIVSGGVGGGGNSFSDATSYGGGGGGGTVGHPGFAGHSGLVVITGYWV
jgi:mucin-19